MRHRATITPEIRDEVIRQYTTRLPNSTWKGSKLIAADVGISDATVLNILHTAGVPVRSAKEAHAHGKRCGPVKYTERLGDPSLCQCGCGQPTYWDRTHQRWARYVKGHRYQPAPFKDETWLREQYERQRQSAYEIADGCDVGATTIFYYLRKFGIERRDASESKIGRFTGSRNPAWKGGIAQWEYTPEWKRIAHLIRKRDHYTCQMCGEQQPPKSKTLHVHHIDGDKTNNEPSNLVTVCAVCHPKGKRKERFNKLSDPHYRTKWLVTRKGEIFGLDTDAYMMTSEAITRLGVGRDVITDLIKAQVIAGKKIGGFWYIERESFERFAPTYQLNKPHRKYQR